MLKIKDVFLNLLSISVDLQISKNARIQDIRLLKKIKNQLEKQLSNVQKKNFRNIIKNLNENIRDTRKRTKIREEKAEYILKSLESDLYDLKEFDDLELGLDKYHEWKLAIKEGVR